MKEIIYNGYIAGSLFCLIVSCDVSGGGDNGNLPGEPGEIIWSIDHEVGQGITVQPLIDQGSVFFFQDGYLKSYDLHSGELNWKDKISNNPAVGTVRNKLSDDDNLYIDRGFWYRSYKKDSGEVNWTLQFTNDPFEFSGLGGPRISQDEEFLYIPKKRRVLKARKSDGEVVLEFPLDRLVPDGIEQGATNPIPSPFGDDLLYVPTAYWDTTIQPHRLRGNVFAFNKNSGEIIWEFEAPLRLAPTEEFATTDSLEVESAIFDIDLTEDYLIAGSFTFMLLDRVTGELIWHRPLRFRAFSGPGEENTISGIDVGMAIDDAGIYVTTLDGFARKLSWEDGAEQWRTDIIFSNTSIPTVIDGLLYFTNSGGSGIYVIDTHTGDIIFNENPPGFQQDINDVYLSSLGVGEGFMVNVGALRVYALRSFE